MLLGNGLRIWGVPLKKNVSIKKKILALGIGFFLSSIYSRQRKAALVLLMLLACLVVSLL